MTVTVRLSLEDLSRLQKLIEKHTSEVEREVAKLEPAINQIVEYVENNLDVKNKESKIEQLKNLKNLIKPIELTPIEGDKTELNSIDDKPSIIYGKRKEWHRHGVLHRENKPAVVEPGKIYYYQNGYLHNDKGPAIIEFNDECFILDHYQESEFDPRRHKRFIYYSHGELWQKFQTHTTKNKNRCWYELTSYYDGGYDIEYFTLDNEIFHPEEHFNYITGIEKKRASTGFYEIERVQKLISLSHQLEELYPAFYHGFDINDDIVIWIHGKDDITWIIEGDVVINMNKFENLMMSPDIERYPLPKSVKDKVSKFILTFNVVQHRNTLKHLDMNSVARTFDVCISENNNVDDIIDKIKNRQSGIFAEHYTHNPKLDLRNDINLYKYNTDKRRKFNTYAQQIRKILHEKYPPSSIEILFSKDNETPFIYIFDEQVYPLTRSLPDRPYINTLNTNEDLTDDSLTWEILEDIKKL